MFPKRWRWYDKYALPILLIFQNFLHSYPQFHAYWEKGQRV